MRVKQRHEFKPCVPGAFYGGLRRTEFFDGMVLSEADMKREQSYWQMKRRLTNRALGQGVVWGLNMAWDPRTRCFELCPGYGISCCGDDLVVECPEKVCERDLLDPCSEDFRRLMASPLDPCDCNRKPDGPVDACLLLEYVECPEDPRQVFEDPCAEVPEGCRFGAVRETTRLRLVPPPPPEPAPPLEAFCTKIAEIREQIALAAQAAGSAPPPDPMLAPGVAQTRLTGATLDLDDVSTTARDAALPVEEDAHAEVVFEADTSDEVRYTLEPMPGYFFASVIQDGMEVGVGESLMGFATTASEESLRNGVHINLVAEIAPLLGTAPAMRVSYVLTAGRSADNVTTIAATVTAAEILERRRDCVSLLEQGLFLDTDPACVIRTLALAVLCGWFKGQLGAAPCGDAEADAAGHAQAAIAWFVCWLAWRLIWGIDITKDGGEGAEKCLRKLFADWCETFHYKGPRCEHNKHGIVLGRVKVSPKGRIECFDEWAGRRYVLTGPLLTHWAGQFGIAPLDVTATRLAGWICCVARAPMAEQTEMRGPPPNFYSFGSGGFLIGGEAGENDQLGYSRVGSVSDSGPLEIVRRTLNLLIAPDGPPVSVAPEVDLFTLAGGGLQLVIPRQGARLRERAMAPAAVEAMLAPEFEAKMPMARRPTIDFVNTLARELPLSALAAPTENPLFDKLVGALEAEEIVTLCDLTTLAPEAAVERVRPALSADDGFTDAATTDKAMSLVYSVALRTLKDAAGAIVDEAKERDADEAFVRADLAEPATVSAVRKATKKHMRGRGLAASDIRRIAARVAARS